MSEQTDKRSFERDRVKGICYPRFRELRHEITKCHEMVARTHESQCIALGGDRRTGKSFLVRDFAATGFLLSASVERHTPVLYVETPASVTKRGLVATMLGGLGVFGPFGGDSTLLSARLFELMSRRGVKLVVLDDVHRLIGRSRHHALGDIVDLLEEMIKRVPAVYLLVGPESAVEQVLSANSSLYSMFARELLEPFEWNESNPQSIATFARFLELAEAVVEVPLSSEMPRNELLFRIHWATSGVIGHIMKLLQYTAVRAKEEGKAEMDVSALRAEFDKRLAKYLQRVNPFAAPVDMHFTPEACLEESRCVRGNRGRPKTSPAAKKALEEL